MHNALGRADVITCANVTNCCCLYVQVMIAVPTSFRSSLKCIASAQLRPASTALQEFTTEQQSRRRAIDAAAAALGLSLDTPHCQSTGTLRLPLLCSIQDICHRHRLISHSQPAARPATAMASDTHRPRNDTQIVSSAARQDERSGKSTPSLWQQLCSAGNRGIKRKLQTPFNGGQHRAGTPDLQGAARRPKQQHKQSLGDGPHRQAQPGREGVTDLGDGARVLYSPSMFSRTEAAQLLRALQVTDINLSGSFADQHIFFGPFSATVWTAVLLTG